jgi:hypothetical protein
MVFGLLFILIYNARERQGIKHAATLDVCSSLDDVECCIHGESKRLSVCLWLLEKVPLH